MLQEELREMRRQMGLTQAEMSRRTGLSQQYISRIESGKPVTLETIEKYAQALNQQVMVLSRDYDAMPTKMRRMTYLYHQFLVLSGKAFVVLSHVAALEALGYFPGYGNPYPVDYYAASDVGVINTVFHKAEDMREIGYVYYGGMCCTDVDRTFNDVMEAADTIDDSVILDSMGRYYYSHGCSFESLRIDQRNKEVFDSFVNDAIDFYVRG
ncbi:MAG: helix-turn-helix transcriptional regulator [Clostridia bacterium]|nr:helix-turn-helix transcriptional regulator [Clostridia bacterium]